PHGGDGWAARPLLARPAGLARLADRPPGRVRPRCGGLAPARRARHGRHRGHGGPVRAVAPPDGEQTPGPARWQRLFRLRARGRLVLLLADAYGSRGYAPGRRRRATGAGPGLDGPPVG